MVRDWHLIANLAAGANEPRGRGLSRYDAGGKHVAMRATTLCPGYFERDVQEIIEANGANYCPYYCALCGQRVIPVNKDGGWLSKNHNFSNGW
jgi:hypothetical protein